MAISRIQKIELRKIWNHEATNFTRCLTIPKNVILLSDEINIESSLMYRT